MTNPLNQLPIDPDMVRRVDALAEACAKETGHLVIVIVMKEDGKTHVTVEGIPETGWVAELAKDPPSLLMMTAQLCGLSDHLDKAEPRS